MLAFALTVHKAQGLSLRTAIVDAGSTCFGTGMLCVALPGHCTEWITYAGTFLTLISSLRACVAQLAHIWRGVVQGNVCSKCPDPMQRYKSLHVADVICTTLVNTHGQLSTNSAINSASYICCQIYPVLKN